MERHGDSKRESLCATKEGHGQRAARALKQAFTTHRRVRVARRAVGFLAYPDEVLSWGQGLFIRIYTPCNSRCALFPGKPHALIAAMVSSTG